MGSPRDALHHLAGVHVLHRHHSGLQLLVRAYGRHLRQRPRAHRHRPTARGLACLRNEKFPRPVDVRSVQRERRPVVDVLQAPPSIAPPSLREIREDDVPFVNRVRIHREASILSVYVYALARLRAA